MDVTGTNALINLPPIFWLIAVWSLIWKAIALWKAAQAGQKVWYAVLFVVNVVGILEILYIFYFSKKGEEVQSSEKQI